MGGSRRERPHYIVSCLLVATGRYPALPPACCLTFLSLRLAACSANSVAEPPYWSNGLNSRRLARNRWPAHAGPGY